MRKTIFLVIMMLATRNLEGRPSRLRLKQTHQMSYITGSAVTILWEDHLLRKAGASVVLQMVSGFLDPSSEADHDDDDDADKLESSRASKREKTAPNKLAPSKLVAAAWDEVRRAFLPAAPPAPPALAAPAATSDGATPAPKSKRAASKREYVPGKRTGNYAVLICLDMAGRQARAPKFRY